MLEVTLAQHVADYRIWLTFSDGTLGIVDLRAELWGPVFDPLRDHGVFRSFEVSGVLHTVRWQDDADFASEF